MISQTRQIRYQFPKSLNSTFAYMSPIPSFFPDQIRRIFANYWLAWGIDFICFVSLVDFVRQIAYFLS